MQTSDDATAEPPDCDDCAGTGGVMSSLYHRASQDGSQPSLLLNQLSPSSLYPVCQQWPCNCIQSLSQHAFWRPRYVPRQISLRLHCLRLCDPPFSTSSSSPLNAWWRCVLWPDLMPYLLSIILFCLLSVIGSAKPDLGNPCSSGFLHFSFQIKLSLNKQNTRELFWDASEILIL